MRTSKLVVTLLEVLQKLLLLAGIERDLLWLTWRNKLYLATTATVGFGQHLLDLGADQIVSRILQIL